jgi:hypothetical protein
MASAELVRASAEHDMTSVSALTAQEAGLKAYGDEATYCGVAKKTMPCVVVAGRTYFWYALLSSRNGYFPGAESSRGVGTPVVVQM